MKTNQQRWAAVLMVCLASPLACCAGDMNRVVRDLEVDLGVRHTHIPVLGAALFLGKVASGFQMPAVKLAVFEDEKLSELPPEQIEHSLLKALGPQWSQFIKSTSHYGDEQNWIYVNGDGKKLQMVIASMDRDELSLIQVKVSPRQMRKWINDTDEMSRHH